MQLRSALIDAVEAATVANAKLLELLNWHPTVVGFSGYGNTRKARVLARVLMGTRSDQRNWLGERRGWRQFFDAQSPREPVLITLGGTRKVVTADRGGYIDAELEISGLEPGWHTAQVQVLNRKDMRSGKRPPRAGQPSGVPVRIVGDEERVGIISDVDDTIMLTMVPERLQALRYVLVEHTSRRRSIAGMADLLKELQIKGLQLQPPAGYTPLPPVFYLSNGAWNVSPTLRRFLTRERFPQGGVLLRPWGINAHGLPPRGITHKLRQFEKMRQLLPQLRWFLVGDDGEYDPYIYQTIAAEHPESVLAILIRTLSGTEHLALHGTTRPPKHRAPAAAKPPLILHGKTGFTLQRKLQETAVTKHIQDQE